MKRDDLYDLAAFAVVAEEGSFTRAAAELAHVAVGAEPRHQVSGGAARGAAPVAHHALGIDDRSGRDTAAHRCAPRSTKSPPGVDAVGALRGKASGTVRITATKHAVSSVIMPVLPRFLASHPDIQVDMIVDDNLTDIVADRIDAGIRFGDIVEKDMIAVRIGPDIRMSVVGAPSYFAEHPEPRTPRELSGHRCINYRLVRSGGLYAWDFENKGRPFEVRVEGPLVFNNSDLLRESALGGPRARVHVRRHGRRRRQGRSARSVFWRSGVRLPGLLSLSPQPAADAARTGSAHRRAALQGVAARDRVGLAQTILRESASVSPNRARPLRSASGQNAKVSPRANLVRISSASGSHRMAQPLRLRATSGHAPFRRVQWLR